MTNEKTCLVKIKDEVNIQLLNLDPVTRRKLVDAVKYFVPSARHMPAYKLGRWDGYVSFCDVAGRSYLNLIDRLIPIVIEAGYELEFEDLRNKYELKFQPIDETSYQHICWPANHPVAPGKPIVPKQHQIDYVNTFLTNPQGVGVAPTAAGKTLCTAIMAHKIEEYGRSVTIVPTKDLVVQTEKDYRLLGLDVGVFYGDRKEFGKTHTICTWQSLDLLTKKTRAKEAPITIGDFLEGVAGVIVDEAHKAKSTALRELLTGPFANVPIRWGLTGTIPKQDQDSICLEIGVGPTLGRIKAKDLQDAGVLSQCHIHVWQMQDGTFKYPTYQDELAWLTGDYKRLKFLAGKIKDLAQTGNTLVLVDRIKTGDELLSHIPDAVFISGSVASKDREKEYDAVATENNKVIIATSGVASTGINIPRVFNLVLFEPGKSFVKVIQSIGRGLRKAQDKDYVDVYDLSSTLRFSKKHLLERKKFYDEAEYPYTVHKINWI